MSSFVIRAYCAVSTSKFFCLFNLTSFFQTVFFLSIPSRDPLLKSSFQPLFISLPHHLYLYLFILFSTTSSTSYTTSFLSLFNPPGTPSSNGDPELGTQDLLLWASAPVPMVVNMLCRIGSEKGIALSLLRAISLSIPSSIYVICSSQSLSLSLYPSRALPALFLTDTSSGFLFYVLDMPSPFYPPLPHTSQSPFLQIPRLTCS